MLVTSSILLAGSSGIFAAANRDILAASIDRGRTRLEGFARWLGAVARRRRGVYDVKIRRPDTLEEIAAASGVTWEEAAFRGYDAFVRGSGGPRRYLARVEAEPRQGEKLVRFGFLTGTERRIRYDPSVLVSVARSLEP